MRTGQRADNGVYPKEKANPNTSVKTATSEPKDVSILESVVTRLDRVAGSIQNSVGIIDTKVATIAYIDRGDQKETTSDQEKSSNEIVSRINSQIRRLEYIENWLFRIESDLGEIVGN